MTARLFCKYGELRGAELEIVDEATIGRYPAHTLVLDSPLVSGDHARIFRDAERGCYVLEDLGSTNGTELDGLRLESPERLGHLHVVTFAGEIDFVFQDLERCARRHRPAAAPEVAVPGTAASVAPDPEASIDRTRIERDALAMPELLARLAEEALEDTAGPSLEGRETAPLPPPSDLTRIEQDALAMPELLARLAEEALVEKSREAEAAEVGLAGAEAAGSAAPGEPTALPRFHLEVTHLEGRLQVFELRQGENQVGRSRASQVFLDSLEVSRRHALITIDGERVSVRDLGSSNLTYLDDVSVGADTEVPPGSRLRFGAVEARLVRRAPAGPGAGTGREER